MFSRWAANVHYNAVWCCADALPPRMLHAHQGLDKTCKFPCKNGNHWIAPVSSHQKY